MCEVIGNIENKYKDRGVFADGAYDANANFEYLSSRHIQTTNKSEEKCNSL